MTADEVRSHPLFEKLNERQKVFFDALLKNGRDKIAAAKAAWTCSTEASARAQANRALADEFIAQLCELYWGRDPERERFTREQALEFAASKARSVKDPKLSLDYLKLIAVMEGWLVKAADSTPKQERDDSQDSFSLD